MQTFPEHAQAVTSSLANQPMTKTGLTQVLKGLAELWEMDNGPVDVSFAALANTCYKALPARFQA